MTLLAVSFVHGEEQGKHLFILSGQSNMVGLNPKQSFMPRIQEMFGEESVIVVKDAKGGQPIRKWYKKWESAQGKRPEQTGQLYDRLMKKVVPAISDKKIKTVTFIWMQGERDANEGHGKVYASSLAGLLGQLKNDLGRENLNVVIGRLSDFDMDNSNYPHWTMVRRAQMKVAENTPNCAWVNTDDLNGRKDKLHYITEGYKKLGKRFADTAIQLIKNRTRK